MPASLKAKLITYLESLQASRPIQARLNKICMRLNKTDIEISDTKENTSLISIFIGKLFTSQPELMTPKNKKQTEEFSARYIETPAYRRKRDPSV